MKKISPQWDLRITKGDNGYRVNWLEDTEDIALVREMVFEEVESCELETMKDLLWFIKEHFGVYHSKHNKQNLVIEIQDMNG